MLTSNKEETSLKKKDTGRLTNTNKTNGGFEIDRKESNLSKRSGGRNNPTSKQVVASEELVPALLVLVGVTLSYKGLWQARETKVSFRVQREGPLECTLS